MAISRRDGGRRRGAVEEDNVEFPRPTTLARRRRELRRRSSTEATGSTASPRSRVGTTVFFMVLLSVVSYLLVQNRKRIANFVGDSGVTLAVVTDQVPEASTSTSDVVQVSDDALEDSDAKAEIASSYKIPADVVRRATKLARDHYVLSAFFAATVVSLAVYSGHLPFLGAPQSGAARSSAGGPLRFADLFPHLLKSENVDRDATEIESRALEQLGVVASSWKPTESLRKFFEWLMSERPGAAADEPTLPSVEFVNGLVGTMVAKLKASVSNLPAGGMLMSLGKMLMFAGVIFGAGQLTTRVLKAEVNAVTGRFGVVRRQIWEREQAAQEAENVVNQLQQHVTKLEAKLEMEREALKSESERAATARVMLKQLKETSEGVVEDKAAVLEAAGREAEDRRAKIAAIVAQIKETNEEIKRLEAERAALQEEVHLASVEVASLVGDVDTQRGAVGAGGRPRGEQGKGEALEQLEKETQVMLSVIDELNSAIDKATTLKDITTKRVIDLQNVHATAAEATKREQEETEKVVQAMCDVIDRIENDTNDARSNLVILEEKLKDANAKIEAIRQAAEGQEDPQQLRAAIQAQEA
uniref:Putative transmembrane protein n=1 Tax=Toxoplasma gondii COUG TaxID=1074873 RepID=A0A2G8Y421_TOXGO|nr:putative transmembrane protein [Toxoplasma gondii COUG]